MAAICGNLRAEDASPVAALTVRLSRFDFVRNHLELDKLGDPEGHADWGIRRIPSPCHHDTSNPWMLVPGIHREPPTFQKYLEPCAEIHRAWIGRNADIAKISRAIASRNVHATT